MPRIKKKRLCQDTMAPATPNVTAPNGPLLDIPVELHADIAKRLGNEDLFSLRLVCRQLEKNSHDVFGMRFFAVRRHIVTTHSLRVLRDISATPSFARHIQRVELVAIVFRYIDDSSINLVSAVSGAKTKREFIANVNNASKWIEKECMDSHDQQAILLRETIHNFAKLSLSPTFKITSDAAPNSTPRIERLGPRKPLRERLDVILGDEGKVDWWQQEKYAHGLKVLHCRAWPETTSDDLANGAIESIVRIVFEAASRNPSVVKELHIGEVEECNSLGWLDPDGRYTFEPFLEKSWEFLTNLTDLRFVAYNHLQFWQILLPIATNITSLHIELPRDSDRLEEVWEAAAHLNLQRIGITGGYFEGGRNGWREFLGIPAAHSDTLLELSIEKVMFRGADEEDRLEIVRWIREKQTLTRLNVSFLAATDVRGTWTLMDGEGNLTFTINSTEQKEGLTWIYYNPWP